MTELVGECIVIEAAEFERVQAENARLREKIEILEAEIRVMRRLPAAVNAAVDAVIAADGQAAQEGK